MTQPNPWIGQRTPEYLDIDRLAVPTPGAGGPNIIVGGAEVSVDRPGKERFLAFQVQVGTGFRYVTGDYVQRVNFQGDDTGGVEDDILVFGSPHGLETGDGPYKLVEGTTLPTGLDETALYFVRAINTTTIALYLTRQDAIDDANRVDIETDGSADNDLGGMPPSGAAVAANTSDGYTSLLLTVSATFGEFSGLGTTVIAAPERFTVFSGTAGDRLAYWWIP